jgi:hypothetical protein
VNKTALVLAAAIGFVCAGACFAAEKADAGKAKAGEAKAGEAKVSTGGDVLFENDRVKVHRVVLKREGKRELKKRSARIQYVIRGGKARFHTPTESTDMELKPGQVIWRDAGVSTLENVGDTDIESVFVHLKEKE